MMPAAARPHLGPDHPDREEGGGDPAAEEGEGAAGRIVEEERLEARGGERKTPVRARAEGP